MIGQELSVLSQAPAVPGPDPRALAEDGRSRRGPQQEYSERLDNPLSSLTNGRRGGPILTKEGKPLQPFTLTSGRQQVQQGVFGPGHNLPTMSIDEYLEEEKRRGNVIEGGGEQSMRQAVPNEDDLDKADEETMKARAWDEYKEANPKGSGNTLNRG